jgi:hypothetical protein
LETKAAGKEHVTIANRVRKALASLWSEKNPKSMAARLERERALKLQNYFTQPFYCAEPWTKLRGATVVGAEALRTCREILDGAHDDVPIEQFYFRGSIDDIRGADGLGLAIGPVRRLSGTARVRAVGSVHSNDRFRCVAPIAARPGEGRFTQPKAATQF